MDTPTAIPNAGQQLFAAIKQTTRAGQPGLVLPVGQPLAAEPEEVLPSLLVPRVANLPAVF